MENHLTVILLTLAIISLIIVLGWIVLLIANSISKGKVKKFIQNMFGDLED